MPEVCSLSLTKEAEEVGMVDNLAVAERFRPGGAERLGLGLIPMWSAQDDAP
jgi:hypothetical protein